MKKVLLASTALVFAGGMAMAEVEVSGDGRMGIIGGNDVDPAFTSRVRFSFTGSGETDGGLTFGGSLASDDSGDDGTSGSVFVEGAFGKISMGDVDGAANAAVGHVSGVGLTGLGDLNEMTYIANVGPDLPGVLYENSFGDFTFYASADNPGGDDAMAVGVSYGFGNYTIAAGYETTDGFGAAAAVPAVITSVGGVPTVTTPAVAAVAGTDVDHWVLGLTAAFGDATVKATYGSANGVVDDDQWAVSADYVFGMTTVTAFYKEAFGGVENYGLGASYDLGGGAALKAGIVDSDSLADPQYDFGISLTF